MADGHTSIFGFWLGGWGGQTFTTVVTASGMDRKQNVRHAYNPTLMALNTNFVGAGAAVGDITKLDGGKVWRHSFDDSDDVIRIVSN